MIKLSENTIFADRYQFQRLLGRGGFSEVWLAIDKMTDLQIAVKVYAPGQGIDSDGMKDFCNELSQVYNLNHTNLLKPQHVDSWEGMPYLVMTYCPEGSCHRLIGTMTEEQIWKLLHDVASGLAYLHEQEIIHQDIKPDNILIDTLGNYVITDFGISVQSRSTLRKSMNIATGSGTTAYMGPERFSSDPTPLKASDIWSLGATVYELLTGNAPFGEIGGGMQKSGADLPTIKQDISSNLRMVLAKMLALETWSRPTAEQLVRWTEDPEHIDFAETDDNRSQKHQQTSRTDIANNSNAVRTPNKRMWIIVAGVIVILGGLLGFMQHKKFVANRIHDHIQLNEKCQYDISTLNDQNVLDKLESVVQTIRYEEDFEKKFNKIIKMPLSAERMDQFQGKLKTIQETLDIDLKTTYSKYDKRGVIYRRTVEKIERIDAVFDDLKKSDTKSAHDIHISSDDFKSSQL